MTLLLDTHALIWHAAESMKLSETARREVEAADHLLANAISAWEIGMLVEKGRLSLVYDTATWVDLAGKLPKFHWISLDPEVAVNASRIPGQFRGDPADRLITATALTLGIPIVTADRRIRDYPHVKTIW